VSHFMEQSDQRAIILHIAAPVCAENNSAESQTIGQWISDSGAEIAGCPDVYLGLVRLLRSPKSCGAAIVCVNDLSTPEFEFFSILARACRDFPVLVYGSHAPQRVIQALENGAKALATREAVLDLCASLQRRVIGVGADTATPAPPHAVERTEPIDLPHSVAGIAEAKIAPESTDLAEETGDPEIDEASDSSGVRVPWLRYTESPVRQGPPTDRIERDRPVRPGDPVSDSGTNDQSYEPLLTAEELAALLGDDPDDLANLETGI